MTYSIHVEWNKKEQKWKISKESKCDNLPFNPEYIENKINETSELRESIELDSFENKVMFQIVYISEA